MYNKYFSLIFFLFGTLLPFFTYAENNIYNQLDTYIQQDSMKARQAITLVLLQQSRQHTPSNDIITKLRTQKLITYLDSTYLNTIIPIDDTLTKYVSPTIKYSNPLYKPADLISLEKSKVLSLRQSLSPTQAQFRRIAYPALLNLATAFHDKFHTPLHINSARRSYHEQQNKFDPSCYAAGICALPGTSEHQNGFTLDLGGMRGEQYEWMKNNAHLYGFHQSYQADKDNQGIQAEPRHRRYIGKTLASYLHEQQLSFSERQEMQ